VAVHALGLEELRALRLTDHDAVYSTLAINRGGLPFTIVLDELVAQILVDWLRARAERWPRTRNPHLLITGGTALGDAPISPYGLGAAFREIGISARQLRADRILDEAHHTADPLQLMRVFGLGVTTAVRYVRAAHPDRYTPDPTMA
jgi:hypothetical protein